LSDKIGRWKMLVAGYALFAVTLFGFMLATTLPIFICCFITYGIALAIIQVTHKAYASDLSPSHLKATSLGVFESITGLALFGSGILTGILWDILPHALVFMLTGILALTASALMMVLKKRLFIDTNLQAAAQ
jgi:MFS family permease